MVSDYFPLPGENPGGDWAAARTAAAFTVAVESGRLDLSLARLAEGHALLAAATEAGCSVLQASDITVETSARRHARAPQGFSHVLRALASLPQPQ